MRCQIFVERLLDFVERNVNNNSSSFHFPYPTFGGVGSPYPSAPTRSVLSRRVGLLTEVLAILVHHVRWPSYTFLPSGSASAFCATWSSSLRITWRTTLGGFS